MNTLLTILLLATATLCVASEELHLRGLGIDETESDKRDLQWVQRVLDQDNDGQPAMEKGFNRQPANAEINSGTAGKLTNAQPSLSPFEKPMCNF